MSAETFALERVRHPVKARRLVVERIVRESPQLVRVTLVGPDLADFASASFDDHVKLMFPAPGATEVVPPTIGPDGVRFDPSQPRPLMRDYTPRRFDPQALELDIEFVLHGVGPASTWAEQARVGQTLVVAGPRGSLVPPARLDWHLLVGDDTALPAIRRRLEALDADQRAFVLVETDEPATRVPLSSRAGVVASWAYRDGTGPGLLEQLRELSLPPGDGFAWAAAESALARSIRQVMIEELGIDKRRVRASSYWRRGAEGVHETLDD
ncbi:MAG: siderophore-interacting protein [Burkholderiaceae bacterium]